MASKIMTKLNSIKGQWAQALGSGDGYIKTAEEELGVTFPKDYKEIVKEFGALTLRCEGEYWVEWTGCNVADEYDVVLVTKAVRESAFMMPTDIGKAFVLQKFWNNTCILMNEQGEVFYFNGGATAEKVCDGLLAYMDVCMSKPLVGRPPKKGEAVVPPKETKETKEITETTENTAPVSTATDNDWDDDMDEFSVAGRYTVLSVNKVCNKIVDYECDGENGKCKFTKEQVIALIKSGQITNATTRLSRGKEYVVF